MDSKSVYNRPIIAHDFKSRVLVTFSEAILNRLYEPQTSDFACGHVCKKYYLSLGQANAYGKETELRKNDMLIRFISKVIVKSVFCSCKTRSMKLGCVIAVYPLFPFV